MPLNGVRGIVARMNDPAELAKMAQQQRANEILAQITGGKDLESMSDAEFQAKFAEIKGVRELNETLMKEAEVNYGRGRQVADGFMERLAEANFDLKGFGESIKSLNEKLAAITEKINGKKAS